MAETHMIVHLIYPNSTPLSPSFTICPARSPTLGVHIVIGQDGIRCNAFVLGGGSRCITETNSTLSVYLVEVSTRCHETKTSKPLRFCIREEKRPELVSGQLERKFTSRF